MHAATVIGPAELEALVGRSADIASSAYRYRADRTHDENAPESWIALLHWAGIPLDRPFDPDAPVFRPVMAALLWEEIRPVRRLELVWDSAAGNRPSPNEVILTTLQHRSPASSWWNNLKPVRTDVRATVGADGSRWSYDLDADTCGIVLSLVGGKAARACAVPDVRVFVDDAWKAMDIEIEWGYLPSAAGVDCSGSIELYDGRAAGLGPLAGDGTTEMRSPGSWISRGRGHRRGVRASLLYLGTSTWRAEYPFTSQRDDVARTIVTVRTGAAAFSFLAADLEHGPILAPDQGFFVRRTSEPRGAAAVASSSLAPAVAGLPAFDRGSRAASAREFLDELAVKGLRTVRERIRDHEEQTWVGAVSAVHGADLPPHPAPPAGGEPRMRVEVPCPRLTAQWNLGAWHLLRHCGANPATGRRWYNDHPYGILGAETYLILAALDLMGFHEEAADGFDQWLSLPMQPRVAPGARATSARGWDPDRQHGGSMDDRPVGAFTDGQGALTLAEGAPGAGGHMDSVHAYGPGTIGWALIEHYRLTNDEGWLRAALPRIRANVACMLRQRRATREMLPGGERLWCRGLQPAHQATPDSGGWWMPWYWSEAYYCAAVSALAEVLDRVDPAGAAELAREAREYRADLAAAVERSIGLSPVVPVRDGTYRSVVPFACYVRGLGTGAWGWLRDGSAGHWGPLTFETDLSAIPVACVAGLVPLHDPRVQGYLDVLEDRLMLENPRTGGRPWFQCGWQHQVAIQKTIDAHLAADDVPVFLRTWLNGHAIHLVPDAGYVFNEHVFAGPPDKIFEEAGFLVRMRAMLVMEQDDALWIARGTPRAWLEQGKRIRVANAPTRFGVLDFTITSDVDHGRIVAEVAPPSRGVPGGIRLRLRHPTAAPMRRVEVDGRAWRDFDAERETIELRGSGAPVTVTVSS